MEPEDLPEIERRRLAALVIRDIEAAERLHSDDYELVPPHGSPLSKRQYLDAIASGELRYEVFEPASEIRVRRLGVSAAALRYRARILIHGNNGAIDAGLFLHTDIYEARDGRWQAVWSQATRISRSE